MKSPPFPDCPDWLVLKDCIVSIDAMGRQKGIVSDIVEKGADCRIAVKGNQVTLQEQVQDSFRFLPVVSFSEDIGCGHGRIETRRSVVVNNWSLIENREEWPNLRSLVKIETERYGKCRQTTLKETRLYIRSLGADAVLINKAVRSHWGIENSLHSGCWMSPSVKIMAGKEQEMRHRISCD